MTTSNNLKIKRSEQQTIVETAQPAQHMPSQQAQPQYKKLQFRGGTARWVID